MRKCLRKMLIWLILSGLVLGVLPVSADTDETPEPVVIDLPSTYSIVTVGISFKGSAVSVAELSNKVGSGFELGYFDFMRTFHAITGFAQNRLSFYPDSAWHILLDAVCADMAEAAELARNTNNGFAAYIDGQYRVLSGSYESESKAQKRINKKGIAGTAFFGSDNAIAAESSDAPVFLLDSADAPKLAVSPVSGEDKAETWFCDNAYYGAFELCRTDSELNVINYIDIEDYVKGVLPFEVGGDWPEASLMAQAVCARSYAVNNINSFSELGFDLRNDTYSQVYRGITAYTEATDAAAEKTAGQYVRCDGAICKVYYMSSDGGATDSGANVFGKNRSYLRGVFDDSEEGLGNYNKDWECELTADKVCSKLNNCGIVLNGVSSIEPVTSDMGNVIELRFTDNDGKTADIYGEYCFRYLSLDSLRFEMSSHEDKKGNTVYVFSGHGWGHNCGLSQWGAYSLGLRGMSADDIIAYYFNGAYIG